ncbi:hypothetical protein Gpo141_00009848 [Globisporangium polare]
MVTQEQLIAPGIDIETVEEIDNLVENGSILFIVGFRFYFVGVVKGLKTLVRNHKTEMLDYFLFLTHECSFEILDHVTGLSWERVWMRSTIVLCLWMAIRTKVAGSSLGSKNTTRNQAPLVKSAEKM